MQPAVITFEVRLATGTGKGVVVADTPAKLWEAVKSGVEYSSTGEVTVRRVAHIQEGRNDADDDRR